MQASLDASLDSPSKSGASQSANLKHGRPGEVRGVASSGKSHDAFTHASADMKLDSALTLQLSDGPVVYDPTAYSGSSPNMSRLQVTPGAVGNEEQPVTSSKFVARDALRHIPYTDRIGTLESLSLNA